MGKGNTETTTRIAIGIGDRVVCDRKLSLISFNDYVCRFITNKQETIIVPRALSSLGQFVEGYNFGSYPPQATLEEDFWLTGKYTYNNKLMVARQVHKYVLDEQLEELKEVVLDGDILIGEVILVVAYFNKTSNHGYDIEFFEDVTEAMYQEYAYEVRLLIRDASHVEYELNIKLCRRL